LVNVKMLRSAGRSSVFGGPISITLPILASSAWAELAIST